MKSKNLYHVLGLDSSATPDEIKKAYRFYASKFHPDKHQGDKFFEEKFREVKEAYDVLSNPVSRTQYDAQFGADSQPKSNEEFSHNSKPSFSTDESQRTAQTGYIDPVKEKRNKTIFIGIGTLLAAILLFNLGGESGWHIPVGMFFIFWTIRQAFAISTSYLKD